MNEVTGNLEGLFFRTGKNRVIFSLPGNSFAAHLNPTGTVAIFGEKSSDGERSLGVIIKKGTNISGSDFADTFNYVDFGASLDHVLNQPIVEGNTFSGIAMSISGAGQLILGGGNSPVSIVGGTNSTSGAYQTMTCSVSGGSCSLSAALTKLIFGGNISPFVGIPFTVQSDGTLILTGTGKGGMTSDRALYAAVLLDSTHPQDGHFSVVVRQSSGMTSANVTGTYRVITLEEELPTTARHTTRLVHGAAQFDGTNSSTFTTLVAQVDRLEDCSSGACNISTAITGLSPLASETRTYSVTPTGILSFSGGNIPVGASVSGAVSPDASIFVAQIQADNIAGTSSRSITLGVKTP